MESRKLAPKEEGRNLFSEVALIFRHLFQIQLWIIVTFYSNFEEKTAQYIHFIMSMSLITESLIVSLPLLHPCASLEYIKYTRGDRNGSLFGKHVFITILFSSFVDINPIHVLFNRFFFFHTMISFVFLYSLNNFYDCFHFLLSLSVL